ncbi:hypothetical protein JAAARDRAFT_451065 [Jaapia argillacea MUCL 33604]|uniref:Uncharacterized protein n=1 Tax=Jaapia argillacea MUCL 33604 TaxID=933084 RepID=A0A067Q542_9AGAM|nr:hypothetical protein JAAARDRAFT_451065 [Jaapia argillacea MUCL 33604]
MQGHKPSETGLLQAFGLLASRSLVSLCVICLLAYSPGGHFDDCHNPHSASSFMSLPRIHLTYGLLSPSDLTEKVLHLLLLTRESSPNSPMSSCVPTCYARRSCDRPPHISILSVIPLTWIGYAVSV